MEGKIQGVGWAGPITRVGWLQVMDVTRNRSLGWRIQRVNFKIHVELRHIISITIYKCM